AAVHAHALDRTYRAYGGDLRARLLAGADHRKGARLRVRHEFCGEAAGGAGAQRAQEVGLDHRLEPAAIRPVEPDMVAGAALAGEIGLEAEHALLLAGRAHQVEVAAGKVGALARQVGGAGIAPDRKGLLQRGQRVLDGDQAADVGFGEIERGCMHGGQMLIDRALSSIALRSNVLISSIRPLVNIPLTSFTWPSSPAKATCASHSDLLMAPMRWSCHGAGNHLSLRESTT